MVIEFFQVDQRWIERYEVDVKVFSQKQVTQYTR